MQRNKSAILRLTKKRCSVIKVQQV